MDVDNQRTNLEAEVNPMSYFDNTRKKVKLDQNETPARAVFVSGKRGLSIGKTESNRNNFGVSYNSQSTTQQMHRISEKRFIKKKKMSSNSYTRLQAFLLNSDKEKLEALDPNWQEHLES